MVKFSSILNFLGELEFWDILNYKFQMCTCAVLHVQDGSKDFKDYMTRYSIVQNYKTNSTSICYFHSSPLSDGLWVLMQMFLLFCLPRSSWTFLITLSNNT